MKSFRADLHIHTALSPCSTVEMTPPAIVEAAVLKELAMIAICDHNAAGNAAAVQEAAGERLAVIAGMEISTEEDVHVLGLFPDVASACAAAEEVKATLPEAGEALRRLGDQFLMNAKGEVIGKETKMLTASSGFDLAGAVALIKSHGGLAVASHVDRPAFGVIGQLGFFPEDVRFDAIEVSAAGVASSRVEEFRSIGLPVTSSSDSHFPSEVGACCTVLEMLEPTFSELGLAIRRIDGRNCRLA